jgi:hypothetical protein
LSNKEAIGAGICFQGALKTFKTLNKEGYPCLADISESLKWAGFIHMTQNNTRACKRALSEALYIRKQLIDVEPVENLLQAASLLNELYYNSFLGVPPSRHHKAYPFFEEALAIYKQLDDKYQRPSIWQWLQLLRHKSIFLGRGLDKTDAISWYQELNNLVTRIPSSSISVYEGEIQLSLHETGEVLLENTEAGHALFLRMAADIANARKVLFKQDPQKYKYHLLSTLLTAGNKLADAKQWKEACSYLQEAVEMIQELIAQDPDKYHKSFVMPAFNLAVGYSKLNDHVRSANLYKHICSYFEARISEYPLDSGLLPSFMLALTEELLASNRKDEASDYIEKAMAHMSFIADPLKQHRLTTSFKNLINNHFPHKKDSGIINETETI